MDMKNIIEWFKEKMEQAKELFDHIKYKVTNVLKGTKEWVVKADVYDKKGNKILAKTTRREDVVRVINKIMTDIKNLCSSIVNTCKKALGIKQPTMAGRLKEKVTDGFNSLKRNISLLKKIFSFANKRAEAKANRRANSEIRAAKRDLRSREREVERRERRVNYHRGKK